MYIPLLWCSNCSQCSEISQRGRSKLHDKGLQHHHRMRLKTSSVCLSVFPSASLPLLLSCSNVCLQRQRCTKSQNDASSSDRGQHMVHTPAEPVKSAIMAIYPTLLPPVTPPSSSTWTFLVQCMCVSSLFNLQCNFNQREVEKLFTQCACDNSISIGNLRVTEHMKMQEIACSMTWSPTHLMIFRGHRYFLLSL